MPDSLHEIFVNATPDVVYRAWTTAQGLRSWWTLDSRLPGDSGDTYVFGFDGGSIQFHFRIEDETPGQSLRWRGIAAPTMPDEWVGTAINVHLVPADGGTVLKFSHSDWATTDGMFPHCNTTWGDLMVRLRDYCEGNGRGPRFSG